MRAARISDAVLFGLPPSIWQRLATHLDEDGWLALARTCQQGLAAAAKYTPPPTATRLLAHLTPTRVPTGVLAGRTPPSEAAKRHLPLLWAFLARAEEWEIGPDALQHALQSTLRRRRVRDDVPIHPVLWTALLSRVPQLRRFVVLPSHHVLPEHALRCFEQWVRSRFVAAQCPQLQCVALFGALAPAKLAHALVANDPMAQVRYTWRSPCMPNWRQVTALLPQLTEFHFAVDPTLCDLREQWVPALLRLPDGVQTLHWYWETDTSALWPSSLKRVSWAFLRGASSGIPLCVQCHKSRLLPQMQQWVATLLPARQHPLQLVMHFDSNSLLLSDPDVFCLGHAEQLRLPADRQIELHFSFSPFSDALFGSTAQMWQQRIAADDGTGGHFYRPVEQSVTVHAPHLHPEGLTFF